MGVPNNTLLYQILHISRALSFYAEKYAKKKRSHNVPKATDAEQTGWNRTHKLLAVRRHCQPLPTTAPPVFVSCATRPQPRCFYRLQFSSRKQAEDEVVVPKMSSRPTSANFGPALHQCRNQSNAKQVSRTGVRQRHSPIWDAVLVFHRLEWIYEVKIHFVVFWLTKIQWTSWSYWGDLNRNHSLTVWRQGSWTLRPAVKENYSLNGLSAGEEQEAGSQV